MDTCEQCGKQFDPPDAVSEYQAEFPASSGYDTYAEEFPGGAVCGLCAVAQTQSNIDVGSAVQMMNGDEDYDQDHVDKYL